MVTKSEEEDIMNQAIGSKIADYLIKPVNPNQIILTLKKNIHRKDIETETAQTGYQQSYLDIAMQISNCQTFDDWKEVYRRLVKWELDLSATDSAMTDMLKQQKEEANIAFAKFVKQHYMDWVKPQPPARCSHRPSSSGSCSHYSTKRRKYSSSSSTTSDTTSGVCSQQNSETSSTSTKTST